MRYNNPYIRKGAAAPAASPVATRPELIDYRNKLKDANRRISDLKQRRTSGNVDLYTYENQSRMLNEQRTKVLEDYANARKNSQQPATPAQPKQPLVQPKQKQEQAQKPAYVPTAEEQTAARTAVQQRLDANNPMKSWRTPIQEWLQPKDVFGNPLATGTPAKQQLKGNSSGSTDKGSDLNGSGTLNDRDDYAILESKISELEGYGYSVDKESGSVKDSNGKVVAYVKEDGTVEGLDGNPVDLSSTQTPDGKDMGEEVIKPATPDTPSAQQLQAQSTEDPDYPEMPEDQVPEDIATAEKASAPFNTAATWTEAGYKVDNDGNIFDGDELIGTIDENGAARIGNAIKSVEMSPEEHKEQKRQKAAENGAKNPKYNTDIKAWYTDFNFEDPSSWIPRLLAGLLGATLGGTLFKSPLGAVLGGVAGWGLGGGAASNWDTLFSTEEQRAQKALAESAAAEKNKAFKTAVDQTVDDLMVTGNPSDHEAYIKIRQIARTKRDQMNIAAANIRAKGGKEAYEQAKLAFEEAQERFITFRNAMRKVYRGQYD